MNLLIMVRIILNITVRMILNNHGQNDFDNHSQNDFANHQGPTWPAMGKQQRQVFSSKNFVTRSYLQKNIYSCLS